MRAAEAAGGSVARSLSRPGTRRSRVDGEVKRAERGARASGRARSNPDATAECARSSEGQRSAEVRLESAGARDVPQTRERFFLDLPHALARDAEERADLLERHRLLVVQPEIQAQD